MHAISVAWILALTLAASTSGCSSISTSYDYDDTYDFSRLHTYSWLPVPTDQKQNELILKRVKTELSAGLADRGYREAKGKADFRLAIHMGTERRVQVDDWGYAYGRHYGFGGAGRLEVYEYDEGTLIVDMVDAGTKKLFWRGTARKTVDPGATPEKITATVQEAVDKILKNFPPPQAK
jgi:hypothetical protein